MVRKHPAPAQADRAVEMRASLGAQIAMPVPAHEAAQPPEFCDLSGAAGPGPDAIHRLGDCRDKRLAAQLQLRIHRHGEALAGALGAPHANPGFQALGLETHARLLKLRFEPDLNAVLLDLQAKELQSDRAVRLRDHTQRADTDDDSGRIALPPINNQCAAPHVQTATVGQHLAGAQQQRPSFSRMRMRSQSAMGTRAGTGGSISGVSNRPAT